MKINNILLNNFGSYEGYANFETASVDERNIILIGGKNGAGKTTLFTAMRVCLYGYMSMGYKNYNSFYTRSITKLINNTAKMSRPANASVAMKIEIGNGQGIDSFTLTRKWELGDSLIEHFEVIKNEDPLSEEEVADFEKYILTLIPPELFNLYFFDGERIADFFLDEGSSSRIKEAFLTLCGYDTFDIMRKNFKRISGSGNTSTPALNEYLDFKDKLSSAKHFLGGLEAKLGECLDGISNCEASISAIEKEYYQKGGITEEDWNKKLLVLKEEEKKRETYNALLKKWANDIIPFLMIKDRIVALKSQIEAENKSMKYQNFCEILEVPEINEIVGTSIGELKGMAFKFFGDNKEPLLNLSLEQSAILFAQINHILSFEEEKIAKCKKAIKRSLALTAKIRKELESSSVSSVQEYMKKRAQLFEEKSALLVMRVELEEEITSQREIVGQLETSLAKVQARLEDELKKASINDISARAIVMLDKLQQILYRKQIRRVEAFFRSEIKVLMRKTHFIDDIYIDDNFNTHIYRVDDLAIDKLLEILLTNTEEQVVSLIGKKAVEELRRLSKAESFDKVRRFFECYSMKTVSLPMEIDKTSLSNGEKQIFIMALYHSLVNLCTHEIPFIIDTPFARIDTEHRRNISKHFFSKLKGQVFILSTNEEINSSHVQILSDKIAATYMLENTDNKRTHIIKNSYFEV